MIGLIAYSSSLIVGLSSSEEIVKCDWELAFKHFDTAQWQDAELIFQACNDQPDDGRALFYIGLIARHLDDLEQADVLIEEAVKRSPEELGFQLEWAVVKEWQSDLESALAIYQQVLVDDPNSFPARLGVARLKHWLGDLPESLKLYDELLHESPDNPGVINGQARALMADYQLEAAEARFQEVLHLSPGNAEALEGLEQLATINRRTLTVSGGLLSIPGEDLSRLLVSYTEQYNASTRWGISYQHNEAEAAAPPSSGIPINRAIKSEVSTFYSTQFNQTWSGLVSYSLQDLAANLRQHRVQAELGWKSDHQRSYLGVVPSILSGEFVNTLLYGGYDYQLDSKDILSAQVFFANDIAFPDSKALAFSYTKQFAKKSWVKLGNSIGNTAGRYDFTLSLESMLYVKDNLGLRLSYVNSFDRNSKDFSIGIQYEFN